METKEGERCPSERRNKREAAAVAGKGRGERETRWKRKGRVG